MYPNGDQKLVKKIKQDVCGVGRRMVQAACPAFPSSCPTLRSPSCVLFLNAVGKLLTGVLLCCALWGVNLCPSPPAWPFPCSHPSPVSRGKLLPGCLHAPSTELGPQPRGNEALLV